MAETMHKLRKLFVISTVIGLLFLFGVSVSAATSDAVYYLSFIPADKDLYGEKYAPAQKLSSGELQLGSGEVSINEIDVSLPGKNGLDLNIHRIYSSQEPRHAMEYAYSMSKYDIYYEKAYYYTVMDGSGKQILVSFESEAEMVDSFYSTETKLAVSLKEDAYGTYYQTYSSLKKSDGTILLERNKNEYMEEICKETSRVVFRENKGEGNIYLDTDNREWKIAMPYVCRIGTTENSNRSIHYYRFGNEKGEVYTLKFNVITEDTDEGTLGTILDQRTYSSDYKINITFDSAAVTHTLSLTDNEGKTYIFNLGNVINTPMNKITDAIITDRYGNSISYSGNEITDSYGRKLRVTSGGIELLNGTEYKPLVKYAVEEIYDQDRDPQGLLDIFTKTKVTVSRNTSLLSDTEDVFDDTVYITQKKETDSPVKNCENSFVSVLNEVLYSDGQKYVYTYEDENTKFKDPIDYYTNTYRYTVPRVLSCSEQIKDGTTYTEKMSRVFTYTDEDPSETNDIATSVTEEFMLKGVLYKTVLHEFDFVDKIITRKEEYNDDNKYLINYMYKQPTTIETISDIDREDHIDFRQIPVSGIMVEENGVPVDITYMEYTQERKPTLVQKGAQKETYVYDETYGFVLEHTKTTDKGKLLRTVNTKTDDGKSIAKTEVFEVVDGTEALNNTTTYTYNTDGTVASETTESGGTTSYAYDYSLFGNSENGKHSVTASIVTSDASGTSRTETTSTEYDLLGNVKKVTDGNGNATEYTYDLMRRIVEETYADGSERTVAYDDINRIVTVTEPNGKKIANEYNHKGNLLKTYLPDENNQILTSNVYDELERKIKSTVYTDAQNTVSEEYEYDFFDRVIKKTDLENNTVLEVTNYSITNDIETVTFASYYNHETVELNGEYAYAMVLLQANANYNISYDPYVITEVDGVEIDCIYGFFDDVKFSLYDISGADIIDFSRRMSGSVYIILVKNEDLGTGTLSGTQTVTSTFAGDESFVRPKEVSKYDHSGAVIYTERRDNITDEVLSRDEYDYDFLGNVTEYRDSKVNLDNVGAYTSRIEYNYLGQPTKEINAVGDFKTYTYDNLGRLLTAEDETGAKTTYTYDVLGREIVSETDITETEKTKTEKYYDLNGNVVKERIKNNALGSADTFKEVTYEYDSRNRLITTKLDDSTYTYDNVSWNIGDDNSIVYTQYAYDVMGNVTKMANGQINKFDLSQAAPADTTVISYEYDQFGNVTKQTNTSGKSETAIYNLIGLPTSTTDKNEVTTTYTYNAYGSPLTVSTAGMDTITYTYNVNNVLLKAEQGDDVITYEYDSLGRLTKETENGIVKTYQTDKVGNVTYAEIAGVGTTYTYDNLNRMTGASFDGGSASYTYDDAGRLTGETKGGITTTYTYNPAGWLSSKTNTDGTETDTYALTYYTDGNIRTKTENDVAMTYVYDDMGNLRSETGITYNYDSRGNRVSKNAGNTYIMYEHDDDNRMIVEEQNSDTEIYYFYDNNGNMTLKQVFAPDPEHIENPELLDEWRMTYDSVNRMTGFQRSGVSATYTYGIDNMRRSKTVNNVTTNYIWDGANIAAEANSEGTITNRYFRGVGLIASKTGDTVSYYQTNSHGDVSKWGTVDYSYDAFGNETTDSNGINPFRYNGEYFDEETGFIYLRNRYYDSTSGRFTTEDPIRDGLNWYAYCANNPIMFVDPWGLNLYLQGTGDEVQAIWQEIKNLSHDELVLTQLKDDNGKLTNKYIVTVGTEKSGQYVAGTSLIRDLVRSDHNCVVVITSGSNEIKYANPTNASNGNGSDSTVYFNPDYNPDIPTVGVDGNVYRKKRPSYIGLSHEFVHADHAMRGVVLNGEREYFDYQIYTSRSANTIRRGYATEIVLPEELFTIGLKYNKKGYITENMIRAEHNLALRGGYGYVFVPK